jgi:hypothetical protein
VSGRTKHKHGPMRTLAAAGLALGSEFGKEQGLMLSRRRGCLEVGFEASDPSGGGAFGHSGPTTLGQAQAASERALRGAFSAVSEERP